MVRQTHHTPPVLLSFSDSGTEFSGFLGTALFGHLAYHALQTVFLGLLLLDDIPYGITPVLSPFSPLVLLDDFSYSLT